MSETEQPRSFETTHWSVVLAAGEAESEAARDAMDVLCRRYWYPLYAFLRRRVGNPQDAQDLTQAFFARLVEKNIVARADPARGRFRSFLLASLNNFLHNHWDRQRTLKRDPGNRVLSLEVEQAERRFNLEPTDGRTPEAVFEREWATGLMAHALRRLRKEYEQRGKLDYFQALRGCLSGDAAGESHREVAARFGTTPGAVKTAAHRLRRRYGELLRDEVAATVADGDDVDDELRCMFSALAG